MTEDTPTAAERETFSAYRLASLAGIVAPDSLSSAGAKFLTDVADYLDEKLAWAEEHPHMEDSADMVASVADTVVPVYTWELWRAFIDLGAWQEDIAEIGADTKDLTEAAGIALYSIAERLGHALLAEWDVQS